MNIRNSINLWMIRLYALIIFVVVVGNILEDGAFNLVISIATILIILQSFFVMQRSDGESHDR